MPSIRLSSGSQDMTGVEKIHPHNEPVSQFSVVFSEHAIDRYNYCFLFTKGMCVTLKNMCSETKPAGSGSATVISSSHLLWPALDGKWQEVCCVRKLGDITLCVCVRARLHSSIDWYHLHKTSSIVHLYCISPPLTVEYQIWAWTIYEVTMVLSRWLGLMMPFSVAARLWWLAATAAHVVSAPMLLTPGHTRLSYTLPGHNSACKKAFRGHVLYDISTSCQFDVIGW